ncbi:hypothetical protein ACSYAD_28640 [Acaryochloris marina NIES-2412]|uniref:hypothetical protein n=1 Tax=Acaryochloris marina TaxID=155978 RepID=UPI00405838D1
MLKPFGKILAQWIYFPLPRALGIPKLSWIKMNILKKIIGAAILAFNIPRIIELTQTLSNGEITP